IMHCDRHVSANFRCGKVEHSPTLLETVSSRVYLLAKALPGRAQFSKAKRGLKESSQENFELIQ
ncbi:MAG TPA: hypothetical protein VEH56_00595, partial [Candidatus Saccharimonadales bacterium]|nr:hypothetical protein [Candidatus Saccharimonadales bacterium]